MDEGEEDGSTGDGDEGKGAKKRVFRHAEQHSQPGFDVLELRTIGGGGEDGSVGNKDESEGAGRRSISSTLTVMNNLTFTIRGKAEKRRPLQS